MYLDGRTIRVWTNPFAHVDHNGRPAGACPTDPAIDKGGRIGATLTDRTRVVGPRGHEVVVPDHEWTFSDEAIELPLTPYYCTRVRCGELFPADVKTARAAGVKFRPLAEAREAAREAAITEWTDTYGEPPAFAGESEPSPTTPAAPVAAETHEVAQ